MKLMRCRRTTVTGKRQRHMANFLHSKVAVTGKGGVSLHRTCNRLAAQPGFPCLRIGRRIILSRDHVRQWINRGMEVM